MKFTHHDLGYRSGGEIVVITLSGGTANVRLMDTPNFQNYQTGKKYRYYGSHTESSSCRLQIPHHGNWHIVVDTGVGGDPVQSSAKVYPRILSPLNEAPLLSVPSLFRAVDPLRETEDGGNPKFDVFIFFASEDRESVGIPLASALQKYRLKTSTDAFGIKIGDNLRRRIDVGLANSRLAVVILSQAFIEKGWTGDEMDNLVMRVTTGEQIILPIWHNISRQEVITLSPSLANKLARSTVNHPVEELAIEIAEAIKFSKIQEARKLGKKPQSSQPVDKSDKSKYY